MLYLENVTCACTKNAAIIVIRINRERFLVKKNTSQIIVN